MSEPERRDRADADRLVFVAGAACKPKAIRGGPGTENPDFDEGAMSTGLDRKDLQDLMKENMAGLTGSPLWGQWRAAAAPPVVAIWPIKNDTTEHLDDQMLTLLSDMETELINSGVVSVVSRERQAEMMAEAIRHAIAATRPGDVVLLSPACASFDQFRDYEARGDAFRQIVAALLEGDCAP